MKLTNEFDRELSKCCTHAQSHQNWLIHTSAMDDKNQILFEISGTLEFEIAIS